MITDTQNDINKHKVYTDSDISCLETAAIIEYHDTKDDINNSVMSIQEFYSRVVSKNRGDKINKILE